ncbi:ABC transporter ATP-binding protein [Actinoplanes sp. NPDC051859]|uniref:ABC transporter ATP-binding protein n=1 Tax=Actinoplanes sp. NPDC051859 TaxID=3363909 RepID=UPI0037A079F2
MTSRGGRPDLEIRVGTAVLAALVFALRTTPGRLVLQLLLAIVAGLVPLTTALTTKRVFDELAAGQRAAALIAGAVLAGAALTAACVPLLQHYVGREIERRLSCRASDELYRAVTKPVGLARLEDPAFHDRVRLARQSGGDTPAAVTDSFLSVARCVISAVGVLAALAALSPLLAGGLLLACVPVVLCHLAMSRGRAALLWTVSPAERREIFFGGLLVDLQAAKEIRLFGLGDFLRHRMLADRQVVDRQYRRMDRKDLVLQAAAALLVAVPAAAAIMWGIRSTGTGLSMGDVSLLLISVGALGSIGSDLASGLAMTHRQALLYRHYLAVLREPMAEVVAGPALPTAALAGSGIQLRDVWFRYADTGPWVLRGVTFTIPTGRSLALVGANGAGKSTLVKLLCRLYEPTRGAITWDGVDIRTLPPEELRNRITVVFQDYMEYDLSAAENIAIGNVSALDDTPGIRRAAQQAGVDGVITRLPHGYDTLLSRVFAGDSDAPDDVGVQLSGGQWQRLAVARAMFRGDRELMILDEPSSGLDPAAEHELHERLRQLRHGRTSLLISHRLGAVRAADHIVVLDQGRVVEQGDHAGLLAAGGRYARLFQLQASPYLAQQRQEAR